MKARLLRAGDRAILIEVRGVDEVLALTVALRAAELPEVLDLVPAACTVLVQTDSDLLGATGERLSTMLAELVDSTVTSDSADPVSAELDHNELDLELTIPVRYDGPDLDDVAASTGLAKTRIIELHTGTPWRAGFIGFAPGFAYLIGGAAELQVPRRQESRPTVPAGSVALAGEYSAVYPLASPGGWQLIGRTDLVLWDLNREPPGLIRPGTWVRFVDIAQAGGGQP